MAITYKAIEDANASTKPMDIKGSKYIKVAERTKAFRMVYPTGFIKTEIIMNENGTCMFKAVCGYYDDNGNGLILGEGTAREKADTSYINKFSYIENCETSAVGRALGYAGFGIDYEIASKDEIDNKGAEMKTTIQNEPLPDDALKSGVKIDVPNWNARAEISLWSGNHGIGSKEFNDFRNELAKKNIVEMGSYDDMTIGQFEALCKAIQQNYPDKLREMA